MFLFRWLKRFLKSEHSLIKDRALNNLYQSWCDLNNTETTKEDIHTYLSVPDRPAPKVIEIEIHDEDLVTEQDLEKFVEKPYVELDINNKKYKKCYFAPDSSILLKEVYSDKPI